MVPYRVGALLSLWKTVWHERLILAFVAYSDIEAAIITPDGDIYPEDLDEETNAGIAAVVRINC